MVRAQTVDALISGGVVITMDPERRILEDGAVAIDEGRIVEVGTHKEMGARYRPDKVIDASDMVVMPGLIDTHGHSGSLMKTIGIHLEGRGWRRMYDHITFRSTTEDYWYADGLLSALERLRFGTTYGVSILGSAPRSDSPIYGQRYVDGMAEVGVRGMVGIGPARPPWPKKFSHWRNGRREDEWITMERSFDTTEALIESTHNAHEGRIHVWVSASRFSVPSAYDPMFEESQLEYAFDQARRMRETADKHGVGIHTHAYGGVIKYLDDHLPGVLGPDVLLAHCTGVTEEELDIFVKTGTKVAHCPTSKRMVSYEVSVPVPEMIDRGIVVALGADASAPDRTFDMFRNMRFAAVFQRKRFTDPWRMPPGKILEMATIDAARAIGMEDRLGSLEVGKDADVILLDMNRPHLKPGFMIPYRVVHQASGHDVDTVLVRGRVVMEGGKVLTVDEQEVMGLADQEARRMVDRSGVEPLMRIPERFWGSSRY